MEKELSIFDQVYLCKYADNIDMGELAQGLYISIDLAEKVINRLKNNGLYEQYKKLSDEEWENLQDTCKTKRSKTKLVELAKEYKTNSDKKEFNPIIAGFYYSMASRILRKYSFNSTYVGYNFWKVLIALMLSNKEYLKLSLKSDIYPYIATKYNTTYENIESQLKFSLKEATGKQKYTITTFLGMILNMEAEEMNQEEIDEDKKENTSIYADKLTSESKIEVPLSLVFDYYYLKGYLKGIEDNDYEICDKNILNIVKKGE